MIYCYRVAIYLGITAMPIYTCYGFSIYRAVLHNFHNNLISRVENLQPYFTRKKTESGDLICYHDTPRDKYHDTPRDKIRTWNPGILNSWSVCYPYQFGFISNMREEINYFSNCLYNLLFFHAVCEHILKIIISH